MTLYECAKRGMSAVKGEFLQQFGIRYLVHIMHFIIDHDAVGRNVSKKFRKIDFAIPLRYNHRRWT